MTGPVIVTDCGVDERRESLLASAALPGPTGLLNGIDFLEVDPADHRILRVTFLKPLPGGAYGLPADLRRIVVEGGTRIVGIRPLAASVESASVLRIDVDRGGDYSPYRLTLDAPDLDPVKRSTLFSFMASCPTDADCRPEPCPPHELAEPLIDYLAKDYASFRRLLLDLLPTLDPGWIERSPADLGIALVELLAYTGDRLSYYQDAVAGEAYLESLRHRISARRHARLIDYRTHDGRNAWTALALSINTPVATVARGTAVMTALPSHVAPADVTVASLQRDPRLREVVVFETAHQPELRSVNNVLRIHTWGDEECCLPAGTTEAYLYAVPNATAQRPVLAVGSYLIFEEVLGPQTGNKADADPAHRVLVRLEEVDDTATDPLYSRTLLPSGALSLRGLGQQALPLTRVRWRRADALTSPLCISARLTDHSLVRNISVALGNVILADHGLTTTELRTPDELTVDGRLVLGHGPLTVEQRPALPAVSPATGRIDVDRDALLPGEVRDALPALVLLVTDPTGAVRPWMTVPDLLESSAFDEQFVAEVDDEGRAQLRFGDDEYGRALGDATALSAVYRVGNGRSGNVGRDKLTTIALAASTFIAEVRNPLAARGGVDAETIDEIRRLAPEAMRGELKRAVTEADWVRAARELPDVAGAVATFRWTGTWLTIFVAVDPSDRADLVDLPDGRTRLEPAFEQRVRTWLTRFRIAGHDVELRPPSFVGLELVVEVCAAAGYFRTDVVEAVRAALSARLLPDSTRGYFHPGNFTFGAPVYVSRLYAAIERVTGVDSVAIRKLTRFGQPQRDELDRGVLKVGPWEIARLDADPSFDEHGVLTVTARGGKA
ncbi:MAG: putative baseplate assembly protein [Actinomycetota bacterium]|nr:putative baseplate assembly protein [Actinomycetota bacterium]